MDSAHQLKITIHTLQIRLWNENARAKVQARLGQARATTTVNPQLANYQAAFDNEVIALPLNNTQTSQLQLVVSIDFGEATKTVGTVAVDVADVVGADPHEKSFDAVLFRCPDKAARLAFTVAFQ